MQQKRGLGILLFGGFGVPNIGDEAILHGLSSFYSRFFSGTRLYCSTANPNYSGLFAASENTSHHFSDVLFHLRANNDIRKAIYALDFDSLWHRLVVQSADSGTESHVRVLRSTLAHIELIHIAGGGFLNSGLAQSIEIAALLAMMAEKANIPLIISGSQIGPFDKTTLALAEYFLTRTAYCDLRQERGKEILQRLGVTNKVSADDALLMTLYPFRSTPQREASDDLVRINVQLGFHGKEFEQNRAVMRGVIAGLAARYGEKAIFRVLQCFPGPPVSDFDALAPVMGDLNLHPNSVEFIDLSYLHPIDAVSEIAKGHVSIASRMHAAVLSFMAGCPSYSLTHNDGSADRIEFLHQQLASTNFTPFSAANPVEIVDRVTELIVRKNKTGENYLRKRIENLANEKAQELALVINRMIS